MPNKTTGTTIPRGDLKGSLMEHPGKQRYIADILAPVTPVPDKVGVFGVIPVEAFLTMPPSIERAPKAGYNRTEWDLEDQTYRCKEYGHEEVKDDGEAKRYQDYFDYETVLAMRGDTILNVMRLPAFGQHRSLACGRVGQQQFGHADRQHPGRPGGHPGPVGPHGRHAAGLVERLA